MLTKIRTLISNDDGMSTVEYALGSIAAAALAGVLIMVVKDGAVVDAIRTTITDSLTSVG